MGQTAISRGEAAPGLSMPSPQETTIEGRDYMSLVRQNIRWKPNPPMSPNFIETTPKQFLGGSLTISDVEASQARIEAYERLRRSDPHSPPPPWITQEDWNRAYGTADALNQFNQTEESYQLNQPNQVNHMDPRYNRNQQGAWPMPVHETRYIGPSHIRPNDRLPPTPADQYNSPPTLNPGAVYPTNPAQLRQQDDIDLPDQSTAGGFATYVPPTSPGQGPAIPSAMLQQAANLVSDEATMRRHVDWTLRACGMNFVDFGQRTKDRFYKFVSDACSPERFELSLMLAQGVHVEMNKTSPMLIAQIIHTIHTYTCLGMALLPAYVTDKPEADNSPPISEADDSTHPRLVESEHVVRERKPRIKKRKSNSPPTSNTQEEQS